MLDFSAVSDRKLLSRLREIDADPTSYLPGARDEVIRVLSSRYPARTLEDISRLLDETAAAADARHEWVERRTLELLRDPTSVDPAFPDREAWLEAVTAAIQVSRVELFTRVLVLLGVPVLFGMGAIQLFAPETSFLNVFKTMRGLSLLKPIGAIPTAAAAAIAFPFQFLPPLAAGTLVGAVALGLSTVASIRVLRTVSLLRRLHHARSTPGASA